MGMKQYLLGIYQPDGEAPPAGDLDKVMRNVNALVEEMKRAQVLVFNGGLHPPSAAKVVRMKGHTALVTDGPFAETKEHLGGFVIVKAPDLDAVLVWARKLGQALTVPGREADSGLPIEVRQFQPA